MEHAHAGTGVVKFDWGQMTASVPIMVQQVSPGKAGGFSGEPLKAAGRGRYAATCATLRAAVLIPPELLLPTVVLFLRPDIRANRSLVPGVLGDRNRQERARGNAGQHVLILRQSPLRPLADVRRFLFRAEAVRRHPPVMKPLLRTGHPRKRLHPYIPRSRLSM